MAQGTGAQGSDVHGLWDWEELVAACEGKPEGSPAASISGMSIDTRAIRPGDMFIALEGERDGHDFVGKAFAGGAVAALVRADYEAGPEDGALLRVPDTLKGLEAIARAARARLSSDARVIAVTGSVGKTGTKEMLRIALGAHGRTHAPEKSFNNHWGVPLTLARMPRDTQFGVFEIGMNHAGEITPLTRMVRPHTAIVTTVEAVHLEFFESVAAIAEAKAEIFLGLEAGGTAVLNRDNAYFELLAKRAGESGAKVVTFGSSAASQADAFVEKQEKGFSGTDVKARLGGIEIVYRISAPGDHLVMNSLAVIAAVKSVGGDPQRAAAALSGFAVPAGRGELSYLDCGSGQLLLIDESYNANPASMTAAIKVLALLDKTIANRRIAVLGDMLELGDDAPLLHAGLADVLRQSGIDLVFACGPNMKHLFENLPKSMQGGYAASPEGLDSKVLKAIGAGDAVMVKGSLGSKMGVIVSAIRNHVSKSSLRG